MEQFSQMLSRAQAALSQPLSVIFQLTKRSAWPLTLSSVASGVVLGQDLLEQCPGYRSTYVEQRYASKTVGLALAGDGCNVYGRDIRQLTFSVECQTKTRVHVRIFDPAQEIYQVPESVLPRPDGSIRCEDVDLDVKGVSMPDQFSFTVWRRDTNETIFDTTGSPLIFEDQHWRLRTSLPDEPNLYGLGEHTDSLKLNTTDYVRTFWNRDSGAVPEGQNLYGDHPVYFENRLSSNGQASHGVALVNSNGMDIKIGRSKSDGRQYLEYNVLGGIVDLYFFSGPTPFDVARQYSELSGKSNMMPYWSLGYHNCRYGYHSVEELAEVVANHSKAGIPLETMWTDIDYMDAYKVFTLGPEFRLDKMKKFVDELHQNHQHYVMMVDPAIAYQDYASFNRGKEAGIFLKNDTNEIYQGVVWPGLTAYPDWFNPATQAYWSQEFAKFFDVRQGIDIDGLWNDMNEPANFCEYPCLNPAVVAKEMSADDHRAATSTEQSVQRRNDQQIPMKSETDTQVSPGRSIGLPGRDLLNPKYRINNYFGALSNHTVNTSVIHANGMAMYDTHNLFGTMMSSASYQALLERYPHRRPMVITRSTFMGAGSKVGHWLGDNVSTWHHYRQSIRHMLQFTAFFQMSMIGADICGFIGNTTEELCARWTRLGAFSTFMRNHNEESAIPQELYRWPKVAEAAKKALDLRYRLLDYIYSAMQMQSTDGTPVIFPLWMMYPEDPNVAAIELQFFYGPALLINPVTEEGSTGATFYLPHDKFYDLATFQPFQGNGSYVKQQYIAVTEIPVYIRGGSIIPMRVSGANTTAALRKENFELIIAPDNTGSASGYLYLDDGDSLVPEETSNIWFEYAHTQLTMDGSFGYPTDLKIVSIKILGVDSAAAVQTMSTDWSLMQPARMSV